MADLRIVDYASLLAQVAEHLNRQDMTDQIPVAVQHAEEMFNDEIRWRKMLAHVVTDDVGETDEAYENLPSDFLELKSIRFNTDPVVVPDYLNPRQLEQYRAAHFDEGGTPFHYTIVGTQLLFDRVPTDDPELDLLYYAQIPALNATNPTSNLLLDEHPGIYLYGTLLHMEPFLKNDARLATWTALYQSRRDQLHRADRRAEQAPGPLRITTQGHF